MDRPPALYSNNVPSNDRCQSEEQECSKKPMCHLEQVNPESVYRLVKM